MDASDLADRARAWLEADDDDETRAELEALIDGDPAELEARFAGRLEFGTAGLRGLLGAGPTRMNRVVIRQTSAGLADYLASTVDGAADRGVIIGFDGRRNSNVFAAVAARVFLQRGFVVYLGDRPVPTPLVAYGVCDLGCAGGVVVTASHNPPDYNGYKVFWGNGAQIIEPQDRGIAESIEAVGLDLPAAAVELDLDAAIRAGTLRRFGDDLERRYRRDALGLMRDRDAASRASISIAYTPLHGVGAGPLTRLLADAGFDTVVVEPSQAEPDGRFPTVEFPNPEEPGATDKLFELAKKIGADVALANDPDGDRLAVAIPDGDGFRQLTGDQVGALLADYLLAEDRGDDPKIVMTTVVSSQLLEAMAQKRGVAYRETLTGFKWIANAAIIERARDKRRLVLGYEEALGYSVGELVRDKDGLSAALLFAELCAVCKARGQTIDDRLEALYREHGVYLTRQVSLTRPGAEGRAEIDAAMERYRKRAPAAIDGRTIRRAIDLESGTDDLPAADVLIFRLADGARVIMRPSGTEPKLKCYYEVCEPVRASEQVADAMSRARENLAALVAAHQESLKRS
jgi:phosphomannomutase